MERKQLDKFAKLVVTEAIIHYQCQQKGEKNE
jgi:N-glycosylase/DNA lyase